MNTTARALSGRLRSLVLVFMIVSGAALLSSQAIAYGAPGVPDATKSSVAVSSTSVALGDIVRITLTLRDSADAPVTGFDASLIPVTVRIDPDPAENVIPFGPWDEGALGLYTIDQPVGGAGTFHLSFYVEDPPTVLTLIGTFTVESVLPIPHPAEVVSATTAFTMATSLVVTEGVATDIPIGSHTATVAAPVGWEFEPGPLAISGSGADLSGGTATATANLVTLDVSTGASAAIDTFVISGIRLRPIGATTATDEGLWSAPTLPFLDGQVGIRASFAPPVEDPPAEDPAPPSPQAPPVVPPTAPPPPPSAPSGAATPETATEGMITSGSIPSEDGFGLVTFGGGTIEQLVVATGSPRGSMALWTTVNGAFVIYVPGSTIAAVNDAFFAAFPGGVIPPNTPFIGKSE